MPPSPHIRTAVPAALRRAYEARRATDVDYLAYREAAASMRTAVKLGRGDARRLRILGGATLLDKWVPVDPAGQIRRTAGYLPWARGLRGAPSLGSVATAQEHARALQRNAERDLRAAQAIRSTELLAEVLGSSVGVGLGVGLMSLVAGAVPVLAVALAVAVLVVLPCIVRLTRMVSLERASARLTREAHTRQQELTELETLKRRWLASKRQHVAALMAEAAPQPQPLVAKLRAQSASAAASMIATVRAWAQAALASITGLWS